MSTATLRPVHPTPAHFNARGEARVSAQGDEEAETIYLTVGDGVEPADPTPAAHDASISGRFGSVDTGVKISTGKEAIVKAVSADASGALGPVSITHQARRLGQFHKDATDRGVSSTSPTIDTLETITVPGGTLGDNGALRLTAIGSVSGGNGTKELFFVWGGTSFYNLQIPASAGGSQFWLEAVITNDGATNDQDIWTHVHDLDSQFDIDYSPDAEDTTADVDLEVQGRKQSGDVITLKFTMVELLGTK